MDPHFGVHFLRALDQEPRAHSTIRRLLSTQQLPKELPITTMSWMRKHTGLKPLWQALNRLRLDTAPVKSSVFAMSPLLAWASNQVWANEVQWEYYYDACYEACIRSYGGHARALLLMQHVLEQQQTLMPYLAPNYHALPIRPWLNKDSLWQNMHYCPSSVYSTAAAAWGALGTLVQMLPAEPGSMRPELQLWHTRIKHGLYAQSSWHQTVIVDALLNQNLWPTTKCLAACSGDPEALKNPSTIAALLRYMPAEEEDRVALLPWALPAGPAKHNASRQVYMAHEAAAANRATVQRFCPMLFELLAPVLCTSDWLHKTSILNYSRGDQTTLDLPCDFSLV